LDDYIKVQIVDDGTVIISFMKWGDRLIMREKKWLDCSVCGVKGSMRHKKELRERFKMMNGRQNSIRVCRWFAISHSQRLDRESRCF
jgi:hypothetical protein